VDNLSGAGSVQNVLAQWLVSQLAIPVVRVAAYLFVATVGWLLIIKLYRSDEIYFLGLNVKGGGAFSKLSEQFKALSRDSKQKNNFVRIMTDLNIQVSAILSLEYTDPVRQGRNLEKMWDVIFVATINIIKKSKDDTHRVAVFVPDQNKLKYLKLYKGQGYSSESRDLSGLPFDYSFVGSCFTSAAVRYTGNVVKEPLFTAAPNDLSEIKSCLCVPLCINKEVVGVFCIDSLNENAFDEGDQHLLKGVASLISVIMAAERNRRHGIRKITENITEELNQNSFAGRERAEKEETAVDEKNA